MADEIPCFMYLQKCRYTLKIKEIYSTKENWQNKKLIIRIR